MWQCCWCDFSSVCSLLPEPRVFVSTCCANLRSYSVGHSHSAHTVYSDLVYWSSNKVKSTGTIFSLLYFERELKCKAFKAKLSQSWGAVVYWQLRNRAKKKTKKHTHSWNVLIIFLDLFLNNSSWMHCDSCEQRNGQSTTSRNGVVENMDFIRRWTVAHGFATHVSHYSN